MKLQTWVVFVYSFRHTDSLPLVEDAEIDVGHYPFPIPSTQTLQKFNSPELFWLFFILSQRQRAHDLLYLFL